MASNKYFNWKFNETRMLKEEADRKERYENLNNKNLSFDGEKNIIKGPHVVQIIDVY